MRWISLIILRTFHPNVVGYTFVSSAHGTFSRIDHILGHKSNLCKFKKTGIISSIFFQPQCYETRYQLQEKKTVRSKNTQRLNNAFLNKQQVAKEIKREIKKFLETSNSENATTQNLWDTAKTVLRGKFIAKQSYLKKQEKH